jgi:hypothetical protein
MPKYALYVLLLLAGLASSCQKEADQIDCATPAAGPTNALQAVTAKYGVPTQLFRFDNDQTQFISSRDGASIYFDKQSFQYLDGRTLPAHAQIQLELREVLQKSDMILSATPTVSDGRPIESRGEYYLKATHNGARLGLRPGSRLNLITPIARTPALTGMQLFFGSDKTGNFNWIPAGANNPSEIQTVARIDSSFYHVILANDTLGWLNCDRFMSATNTTTVQVVAAAPDVTAGNTLVYFVFRNLNAVMPVRLESGTNRFSAANMPEGEPITAVVIRWVNDKYYFGRQDATITPNLGLAPPLRELTEADLVSEIKRL